jgi:hypothetical protein
MQLDSADLEKIEKTYSVKIGNALRKQEKRSSKAETTTKPLNKPGIIKEVKK